MPPPWHPGVKPYKMKTTVIILSLFIPILSLKAQTPLSPPFISTDGVREQMIELPKHAPGSAWVIKTAQNVLHRYYTISDLDVNVYGTDVLEIDSFIYLNGDYRHRWCESSPEISIWKPFTMKLNQQGEKIWVRTDSLGPHNQHRTYMGNIIQLADGNLLTMGQYESYDTVNFFWDEKTFFIKLDTSGNLIWSKIVGLPDSLGGLLWSLDIVAEPDNGFTTQAYTVSESRSQGWGTTFWGDTTFVSIVKFDQYGNIERMNRFYIGTEKTSVRCSGIIKTDDGGYLLAGNTRFLNDSTYDPYYNRKSFILKVDSHFNLLWTKVFDQTKDFLINMTCINNSATGGYLFATTDFSDSYPIGKRYLHYGKIDNDGNMLWDHYYSKYLHPQNWYAAFGAPMGIVDDTLGNIVIASQVSGYTGVHLLCSDSLGNERWDRWLPYWGEFLYNLRKGEHGGYLLTGIGLGAWLAKTDSIGCVMPGCMDTLMFIGMEEMQQLKKEELIVYPNPATSEVYFALNRDTEEIKLIELYDMQGRQVATLQPQNTLATLHIAHLPKGIYIARVSLGNRVITRKVIKR